MKIKILSSLSGFFSLLLLASILHAEIIQLKNGNAIETKILKEDEKFVIVEASGGKVKIPKSDIQTIWRGTKEQLLEVRGKEVYFAKGMEMYKEGRFQEAAENFEHARSPIAGTTNAVLYANLGSAYASAGEAKKAEENFLKALQGELGTPSILLNLANLYLSTQNFTKAAETFQQYLKKKPDDEVARSGLANCYYALGQFKKALDIYSSLKRANETPFLNNQAAALMGLGRFEEARNILEPLASGPMTFSKPFLNLAEINRVSGKFDSAERQYGIVLAKEPKNIEARIGLARLYFGNKDFAKAEAALNEILETDPNNNDAKYEWAQLSIARGELPKAADQYEEILSKDPKNKVVGNNLGLLYLKMNEPEKALEIFEKLLAQDDRNAKAHANAGLAYALKNDADRALREWSRAVELDPRLEAAAQNKKLLQEIMQGDTDGKTISK